MRTLLLSVCAMLMLVLAACGGGDDTSSLPPAPTGDAGAGAAVPEATATIRGKIAFEGQPPAPGRIQMSADPYCAENGKDTVSEEVVVSDGGLENVIVYVSSPIATTFPAPTDEVVVDQVGCHYTPHVFTAQVNQPIKITNSDETAHNIHAWAEKNMPFNISQAVKGREDVRTFTQEELPLPIRCDVHRWMGAFVGVFKHPYHDVSEGGGAYEIKLAPGSYEISAWHEKYGMQKQMIEVADGASVDLNFSFNAASAAD
jgi:plastocyanin